MTIEKSEPMSGSYRGQLLGMLAIAMALGVVECVFGRVDYSGDAICYLNIVRAIHAADWRLALSSYWGLGYPLLLSAATALFPATPAWEWIAVHLVNLAIYLATFSSFFWLAGVASRCGELERRFAAAASRRLLQAGTLAIFLSIELSLDNVSRVGPDMLVSCLLFAATGLLLQLREKPDAGKAILLGVLLGAGYVVKSIFLPLTLLFCATAALAMFRRRGGIRCLASMLLFAAVFAVPYVAAMSWAAGRLTYGDSGPLNYVWNVNKLEPGGLWQGQPPQFGTPLHPARMVSQMPRAYIFDGPFPVTFGPFFNPPYYYAGVRRFFSLKAQMHAVGGNVLRLLKMLRLQMILYALLICWVLSRAKTQAAGKSLRTNGMLWPMLLVSCCGILVYLLVILESRYIASFVAMLLLALLLAVAAHDYPPGEARAGVRSRRALVWILVFGCALNLLANEKDSVRDVLGNALHRRLFYNQDQWTAGVYLQQTGLRPGDKVVLFSDLVEATLSTWAYMDKLQIVGILGGSLLESQTMDYDAFWGSSPEQQRALLDEFRHTGAKAVLSIARPRGPGAEGWQAIPGTKFWLYRL